jgi:hypothetical protein
MNALRRLGPKKCFSEDNLYTTTFNGNRSTEVEQIFFGEVDKKGMQAVEHFSNFKHDVAGPLNVFADFMIYLSTQRLRTPKGLGWLKKELGSADQFFLLFELQRLKDLYAAIWTECVWLLADASQSTTKFILSDHPVTTYNREIRPLAPKCKGYNDLDIRMHGTHTIFPLSSEKILLLTNRSWALNPYQCATKLRPNPVYEHDAIINLLDIQVGRSLSEQEVREINFIIKRRALRYIAADEEEWLYPENHVKIGDWNKYGNGYLCMPDPRSMQLSGALMIGYKDGMSDAFDPYGRRPWQRGFAPDPPRYGEQKLYEFQGEFAHLFGPKSRGRNFIFGTLSEEEISPKSHANYLSMYKRRVKS